jgi:hypothetical protein
MTRDRVRGLAVKMRMLGYSDELLEAIARMEAKEDLLSEEDLQVVLQEARNTVRQRTPDEEAIDPDPRIHLRALIVQMKRKGFSPALLVSTLRAANGGDLSEPELLALLKTYDVRP